MMQYPWYILYWIEDDRFCPLYQTQFLFNAKYCRPVTMHLQYPQWTQFEKCNSENVIDREISETILFRFNSHKKQWHFFKTNRLRLGEFKPRKIASEVSWPFGKNNLHARTVHGAAFLGHGGFILPFLSPLCNWPYKYCGEKPRTVFYSIVIVMKNAQKFMWVMCKTFQLFFPQYFKGQFQKEPMNIKMKLTWPWVCCPILTAQCMNRHGKIKSLGIACRTSFPTIWGLKLVEIHFVVLPRNGWIFK